MTEFASRLTKVMHERGISQNGLAHVMGISQGTVSAWILKGSIPQPRVLWLLGKALDLSPNWLLTGEEYPPVRHTRPTRVEIELISELNPQANSKPPAAVVELNPAFEPTDGPVMTAVRASGCRFPGISELAKRKGVDRSSLYRHLTGQRPAPLLARDPDVIALQERCQPKEPAPNSARPDAVSMADTKPEWVFRCQFALRCLGVEQRALAKRMGVHQVSFSRWMRGKSPPKPVNLHLIAQILEVPLTWLLRGEGDAEVRAALAKRPFLAL